MYKPVKFTVDSSVKVKSGHRFSSLFPEIKGKVHSNTMIGTLPACGVEFENGLFRWIPESALETV